MSHTYRSLVVGRVLSAALTATAAAANPAAALNQTPIPLNVTGQNLNVIANPYNSQSHATMAGGVTYTYDPNQAMDGTPAKGAAYYGSGNYITYTNGATTNTLSAAAGAIPINQLIASAAPPLPGDNPAEMFYRADGAANDQGLYLQPGSYATLAMAKPTAIHDLYIFASSGNSPVLATGDLTVNFVGGKSESFIYNAGDWATASEPTAFAGGGTGRDYSYQTTPWAPAATTGFNIFQTGLDLGTGSLGAAAYNLPVSSFTFTSVGANPFEYTAIFDISGTPEPGLPAMLVGMTAPGLMLIRARRKRRAPNS